MKALLLGLLMSALPWPVLGQTTVPVVPGQPIVGDSAGRTITSGIRRMGTGFYHRPGDPREVMRATLDNMPVKTGDPSQNYSMLNKQRASPYRYYLPLPDSLRFRRRR